MDRPLETEPEPPAAASGHTAVADESPLEGEALAGYASDPETEHLLREFLTTRDPTLRERLVLMHERMVRYLASRFDTRLVPHEDLVQVGYIGLISALDRFDPQRGGNFVTYAIPTILGEIKRYFRDQTWVLKVPRRLRELGLSLRKLRVDMEQQLGRAPTVQEMAEVAEVSEERLLQAMEADRAYNPYSLDAQLLAAEGEEKGAVSDSLGMEDPEFRRLEEHDALRYAMGCLENRQRRIIRYRFFDELSQAEVARRMGISQMHVSRLERQALRELRQLLAG
jgi:RNA polymerase sigma-B factor